MQNLLKFWENKKYVNQNNIRPIAISSIFMKLIKSTILTRLVNENNENDDVFLRNDLDNNT